LKQTSEDVLQGAAVGFTEAK